MVVVMVVVTVIKCNGETLFSSNFFIDIKRSEVCGFLKLYITYLMN